MRGRPHRALSGILLRRLGQPSIGNLMTNHPVLGVAGLHGTCCVHPMKKFPASPLALVVGIGIGFFVTKTNGPANPGHDAESKSRNDETSMNPRTRPPSRMPSAGKSTTGRTSSSPRTLAGLMNLTRDNWNPRDSIAFLEAVERLGVEEIATMMVDLEKLDRGDSRRYQICNALMNRWAAIDPDGAWDAAMQFTDKSLKAQMIPAVIGAISRSNLDKGRQMLSGIKDPQTRRSALSAFLNQAASEDPEEAFRVLASESAGSRGYGHYQNLFQKWAKDDPDAAIAKLSQIKGTSNLQQAMQGIASALIQEDPAKAAAFLSSLPANNQTIYQFSNLAGQWAQQDLDAARKWVESLPPGRTREQAMNGMVGTLAQTDPARAASVFGEAVVNNRNSYQVGMIVGEWIKTDQTAALAWLDSLDLRGDTQRNVYSQFISNWVIEDPAAAGRYALGIQDEKSRQQTIRSLVGSWGSSDPVAAREWILKSLEGETKDRSLNSLIQDLSYQDHATALQYYQEATANLPSEAINKAFGDAATQIARNWMQNDPKAAGQWMLSLPEGEARTNSIRSVVDQLGDYDIKGAAEFVGTLASGKERDRAVGALVFDLGYQGDPESAFDWAASISDDSQRESAIRQAVNQWKEYDPAAAKAAIAGANISNEARNRILKSLEN